VKDDVWFSFAEEKAEKRLISITKELILSFSKQHWDNDDDNDDVINAFRHVEACKERPRTMSSVIVVRDDKRIFTTSLLRWNLGLFAVNLVSRIRELLFSQVAREVTFQWRCDGSCESRYLVIYIVSTHVKYCFTLQFGIV